MTIGEGGAVHVGAAETLEEGVWLNDLDATIDDLPTRADQAQRHDPDNSVALHATYDPMWVAVHRWWLHEAWSRRADRETRRLVHAAPRHPARKSRVTR